MGTILGAISGQFKGQFCLQFQGQFWGQFEYPLGTIFLNNSATCWTERLFSLAVLSSQ